MKRDVSVIRSLLLDLENEDDDLSITKSGSRVGIPDDFIEYHYYVLTDAHRKRRTVMSYYIESYSAVTVSNTIIRMARKDGQGVSPMKLTKLVYIAHGWNLAFYGKPLLRHGVQAWKYGPVVPEIYKLARLYGAGNIAEYLKHEFWDETFVPDLDDRTLNLLQQVWDAYGQYTAVQLSAITHQQGSPWFKAWHEQDSKGIRIKSIDPELIRDHFQLLARQRRLA